METESPAQTWSTLAAVWMPAADVWPAWTLRSKRRIPCSQHGCVSGQWRGQIVKANAPWNDFAGRHRATTQVLRVTTIEKWNRHSSHIAA